MLTLQQWKQENAEHYRPGGYNEVTPVSAERFVQKISKPDVVFIDEGSYFVGEGNTRYVMYNSVRDLRQDKNRVTNVDVYPSDKKIRYEGKGSVWHEIVGNDSNYDTIVSLIREKVVDENNTDYHDVDNVDVFAGRKWKPDYDLAKELHTKYGGKLDFSWRAEITDIAWQDTQKSLAVDAGFPIRGKYCYLSEDKNHKIEISGWNGRYHLYVYSKTVNDVDSNHDNIYQVMNSIDDNKSLS